MNIRQQQGFSLLEIVVVVVIVGFILGGMLRGQEMITSAKVRRVAGQLDEVRAAYLGFQDRFKALPGDYADADATLDCGTTLCLHGNGDGRIRDNETPASGNQAHEDLLVWTHLCDSGLLKGDLHMTDGESQARDGNALKSAYSVYLQIAFDGMYGMNATGIPRHNLKTGAQIPVNVLVELDRKVDDARPYQGTLQFSGYQGNAAIAPTEGGGATCTTASSPNADWNLVSGNPNCGAAVTL